MKILSNAGHSDWGGLVFLFWLTIVVACAVELGLVGLFVVSVIRWSVTWRLILAALSIVIPLMAAYLWLIYR